METPPTGQQGPVESWSEKFVRKFNENPWVPIGCAATVGALVMSAVKKKHGKSQEMNYWFRARVGLQGATLVALLLGSTWGRDWMKTNFGIGKEIEGPSMAEIQAQKRAQEKAEFEERLKAAQEATAQEQAVGLTEGKMTVKGPVLNTKKVEEQEAKTEGKTVKSEEKTSDAVKKSAGWRLWSKGGSGPESKEGSDSTKTS